MASAAGLPQQALQWGFTVGGWLIAGIFLALWLLASCSPAQARTVRAVEVPTVWRLAIEREAARYWGIHAAPARLAAQIHQESAWRPEAQSPFAQGLSQFTPSTAEWIATVDPDLGPTDPWDPLWAIRAQARYMSWLYYRNKAATECDRWAFALSSYNGGESWLRRDQKRASAQGADSARWFGHVERFTGRAGWARKENRGYVRRILLMIEPAYRAAGWAGSPVCEGVS